MLQTRDFVSISDVISAMILALRTGGSVEHRDRQCDKCELAAGNAQRSMASIQSGRSMLPRERGARQSERGRQYQSQENAGVGSRDKPGDRSDGGSCSREHVSMVSSLCGLTFGYSDRRFLWTSHQPWIALSSILRRFRDLTASRVLSVDDTFRCGQKRSRRSRNRRVAAPLSWCQPSSRWCLPI